MSSSIQPVDLVDPATPAPASGGRAQKLGFLFTGAGLLHFVAPWLFVPVTRLIFPDNTQNRVTTNGVIETVVGLALVQRRTRTLGILGLVGYGAFLGSNARQALLRSRN